MTCGRAAALLASLAIAAGSAAGAAAQQPGAQQASGLSVRAQLTARHSAVLSSEIAGRVITMPVREGQSFREGEVIASIDCGSYEAKLAQTDAQANAAERKAEALKLLDERRAARKIDVDLSVIEIDAAKAQRQLAAIDVSRCRITAPFAGRVAETKVQRFQYVQPGQPVIEVLSDRDLEVELLAPSLWLSWLRVGSGFVIHIDELGESYRATVSRLGARIDPVSQAVKVYATVDGSSSALLPGMSGIASFTAPAQAAVRP